MVKDISELYASPERSRTELFLHKPGGPGGTSGCEWAVGKVVQGPAERKPMPAGQS